MAESVNNRRRFLAGGLSLVCLPPSVQTGSAVARESPVSGFHVEADSSRPDFVTHVDPSSSEQCKIRSSDTGNRFCLLEQQADRGIGVPLHRHMTADEWFFVTAGFFAFEHGGQQLKMGRGETFLIPRRTPHRWISLADKSSFVFGFSPSDNLEGFFSELHQAQNSGHMSMKKLNEIASRYDNIFDGPPLTLAEVEKHS